MEQPVRKQLEQILPRGLAVGSGFVIDSYGGTSRQTDVVLYEKDICSVFSINDTPETTTAVPQTGRRMGLNRALSYDWFSNNANDARR